MEKEKLKTISDEFESLIKYEVDKYEAPPTMEQIIDISDFLRGYIKDAIRNGEVEIKISEGNVSIHNIYYRAASKHQSVIDIHLIKKYFNLFHNLGLGFPMNYVSEGDCIRIGWSYGRK